MEVIFAKGKFICIFFSKSYDSFSLLTRNSDVFYSAVHLFLHFVYNTKIIWVLEYNIYFAYLCITCVWIYLTPLPWVGCNTKWIFELSTTGLNSKFSFLTVCKVEEPSLPYYLPTGGREENSWIHTFPTGIRSKWNENSLIQNWI